MRRTVKNMDDIMKKCTPSGTVKHGNRMVDILRTIAENYEDGYELPEITELDEGNVLRVSSGELAFTPEEGEKIEKLEIASSQIVSENPVEIQLTDEQYAQLQGAAVLELINSRFGYGRNIYTSVPSSDEEEITFSRIAFELDKEEETAELFEGESGDAPMITVGIAKLGIEMLVVTTSDKKAKIFTALLANA